MTEFAYNNAKNAHFSHMPFELNWRYHLYVFYEKNLNPRWKSKTTKKLSSELQNLIATYQQNFHHTQNLQKQAYIKEIKSQNYAPDNKICLNSKHFKIKQNCKLKAKFLGFFQVLHPIDK